MRITMHTYYRVPGLCILQWRNCDKTVPCTHRFPGTIIIPRLSVSPGSANPVRDPSGRDLTGGTFTVTKTVESDRWVPRRCRDLQKQWFVAGLRLPLTGWIMPVWLNQNHLNLLNTFYSQGFVSPPPLEFKNHNPWRIAEHGYCSQWPVKPLPPP